jgi:hypothetical protein
MPPIESFSPPKPLCQEDAADSRILADELMSGAFTFLQVNGAMGVSSA